MADSSIAITAGSGTTIDTRTEGTNSNHRQVVVLGDPSSNDGVAPVDATAGIKVDLGADNDVTVSSGTIVVSSITASTAAAIVDSSGVQYSGSNPVPISDAGGAITVDGTVAATQSGTWTLGENSGVDVGDVTVNNSTGAAAVNIQDGGNSITVDDGASSLTVDGTVAATQSGTWDIGTVTTVTGITNSTASALVDSSGVQYSGSNPVPVSGTVSQSTASNLKAQVDGTVAHDAADSGGGGPVKVGMRAIAHGSNPTAVAAADRTDWLANRHGVPWVIGGHPNIVTLRTNYTTAQTNAALVTVSTGTKIVVTRCSVLVGNAVTVDVQARIGFGTASTPTTTGVVLSHPNIAAGSGVVEGNGSGILGIGADDEDLRITCSVPTSGSIDVMVSYYTIES